jgi:hypothetical protein
MHDISDQVTTKSRRFTSWAKPVEMMATGRAKTHSPDSVVSIDQSLPSGVRGRGISMRNRGQRGHRPVGRLRHGSELVRLAFAFDVVHTRGAQQQGSAKQEAGSAERAALADEDAQERVQCRRLARQLEEAQEPQDAQDPQIEA